MNNDLIVNLPFASRPRPRKADYRNYPAEHSRFRDRAGFLKIDCLLNGPFRSFENLHRASWRASPNCVPSNGTKEMLHREHGGMSVRNGRHGYGFDAGALRQAAVLGRQTVHVSQAVAVASHRPAAMAVAGVGAAKTRPRIHSRMKHRFPAN